jgi:hypothetical protein
MIASVPQLAKIVGVTTGVLRACIVDATLRYA